MTGNSNLVYTIIRKRQVFHGLANLPSDIHGISKCLNNRKGLVSGHVRTTNTITKTRVNTPTITPHEDIILPVTNSETATPTPDDEEFSDIEGKIEASMEGSHPAQPAEPGTLKVSLLDTPAIGQMTEKESAHPTPTPLADFSPIERESVERNVSNATSSDFDESITVRDNDKVCIIFVNILFGITGSLYEYLLFIEHKCSSNSSKFATNCTIYTNMESNA